jgi:predicted TIM-barrel fold metal-dependent hydrolase
MLYSSDHPWVDPKLISGHIQGLKLPPQDEAKIFGENAKKLFKI